MKTFATPSLAVISFLAFALNAAPTYAQTPAVTPAPASTSQPAPQETLTKDGKPKAKLVRAQCRTEAETQGLKGMDKRKAVSACLVKQRPDLAVKEQCRMDGHEKGLKKDGLKSFVKDCAKAKG